MRLRVHHRTEYRYSSPVSESANELRLCPPTSRFQKCEFSLISVLPACPLTHYDDLNLNRVHLFDIPKPHSNLIIDSRSIVVTSCKVDFDALPYGFTHEALRECRKLEDCYAALQDSHYVTRTPDIWRLALDIQGESQDVFETSYAIMNFVFENFLYQSGATNVATQAAEVIEKRMGVCQDFAHATVALCRAIGIPARYVSGYFFDATRDHSLRGSEASHAWAEVYIDGPGWIGLDPTNNKVVDETYVILARGRDYRDVAPVSGTYFGSGVSAMEVLVKVERLKDSHTQTASTEPIHRKPDPSQALTG